MATVVAGHATRSGLRIEIACFVVAVLVAGLVATPVTAQGQGQFVPPHSDTGVDTDGDGLFNVLRVNVNVDATVPGSFWLLGGLYDLSGSTLIASQGAQPYIDGPETVPLDFGGIAILRGGFSGPYIVSLRLLDDAFNLDDQGSHFTQTYSLAQFDPLPARLEPPHADSGEDLDIPPDGLYNTLRVDVRVNVTEGRGYAVFGSMWDQGNTTPLGDDMVTVALDAGLQTVPLFFPGIAIRSSGIDGPYYVLLEVIAFEGGVGVIVDEGYRMTAPYLASDFQASNATLTGLIREAGTGLPLTSAGAQAYNYRDDAHLYASPDASGRYSLNIYEGDWILVCDEGYHQSELYRVHVTGPVTSLDSDLPRALPTPVATNLTLRMWDDLNLTYNYTFVTDNRTFRLNVDWLYGNRDGTASQSELDAMLSLAGPGPVAQDTKADFRVDRVFYDLVPGSHTSTWPGFPGSIDGSVPPRAIEAGTYQSNATITPAKTHTLNLTLEWDQATESHTYSLALPSGIVLRSYSAPPGVAISGIGTANVALDPGPDPNPFDFVYTVKVTLVAGFPDIDPPVIASAVATPDPLGLGGSTTITANVTDNKAVASVSVEVRDPSGGILVNGSASNVGGSDYAYTFTPPSLGVYSFMVWAMDPTGNVASRPGQFRVVDSMPPAISSAFATPNPVEYGSPVVLSAVVADNVGVASASANVTGPAGDLGNFTMVYNATSARYEVARTILELGTMTYVVWASDAAGNAAFATGSFQIRDTISPAITALSASPNPVELGTAVNVSAHVSDLAGVASVLLEVRDPTGALLGTFPMNDIGGGTYAYTYTVAVVGRHTCSVLATDSSGNPANGPPCAFTVQDTTPPTLTGATATPDPAELGSTVSISAQASDISGPVRANVGVRDPSGALVGNFTMSNVGGDAYAYQLTPSFLGTYTFTITVMDALGNPAVVSGTFLVRDTTRPVANAGPDQTVLQHTVTTFDGSGSTDNDHVANYTWTFDDNGPRTLYGANLAYRFDRAGTFVITLTIRDSSGNTAVDGLLVTVTPTTGTIRGTVKDPSGSPIEGAKVRLVSGSTDLANVTTDATGGFVFADVFPGTFSLSAGASGYDPKTETVTVAAGQTATKDIVLTRTVPPSEVPSWAIPAGIGAAVIVAIAIALILTHMRSRRRRDETAESRTTSEAETSAEDDGTELSKR